ncbi:hypothetical protein C4D60_Mb08t30080 [Musa balbisiana]|uniref:Uncharacterized protein n=1 Tax=Musa balbisiana TaxID=52838 RepID=A0A4S8K7I3_MUSBA|nr:hypothetical protein C4D60_Mb08t30080 [Musa balbisiana]
MFLCPCLDLPLHSLAQEIRLESPVLGFPHHSFPEGHALMLAGAVAEHMEVEYQEEYIRNSRGVRLFTCRWLPTSSSPKALVFLCHGYGMECSGFMKGEIISIFQSRMGYLVHAGCCPLSLDSMTEAIW